MDITFDYRNILNGEGDTESWYVRTGEPIITQLDGRRCVQFTGKECIMYNSDESDFFNFSYGRDATMEAICYVESGTPGYAHGRVIFGKASYGSTANFMLCLESYYNRYVLNLFGYNYYISTDYVFDEWAHIAVTRNGSIVRTFFNGKLTNQFESTGTNSELEIPTIGMSSNLSYSPWFIGYIVGVRFSNTCKYVNDFTPPKTFDSPYRNIFDNDNNLYAIPGHEPPISVDLTPYGLTSTEQVIDGYNVKVLVDDVYPNFEDNWFNIFDSTAHTQDGVGYVWQTNSTPWPHWVMIDLGRTIKLTSIKMQGSTDLVAVLCKDFSIQVSTNGEDWTTVHTATFGVPTFDFQRYKIPEENITAGRYVRILIHNSYDGRGYTWAGLRNLLLFGYEV